jgi:hypothetical protein
MSEYNDKDQPCQSFRAAEVSPFNGGAIGHWCPVCDGKRYFCANCHTDHHKGGWSKCHELKRQQKDTTHEQ